MKEGLSVFYIVRNEQECLPKSIASIRDVADEIIVVDCGSSDRTIEVARSCKARVFKYKWDNNFSKARNYALEKCGCRWIMYLDADEVAAKSLVEELQEIKVSKDNVAYYVNIKDTLDGMGEDLRFLDEPYSKSPQMRLFHSNKNIQFSGKANESIEDRVLKDNKIGIKKMQSFISHFLFRGEKKNKEMKEGYYSSITGESINKVLKTDSKMGSGQRCAIIVPSFNAVHLVKRCIDSIKANTEYPYQLYLVDSGSDSEQLRGYLSSVESAKLITLPNNGGAATAINAGITEALKDEENKYFCVLHNDTEVTRGWLESLVKKASSINGLGAIGPVTNSSQGHQNQIKIGWLGRISNEQIIEKVKSSNRGNEKKVSYLSGFCMVLPKDVLKEVGLFDESLGFIGMEEKDMSKRLLDAGFDLYVDHESYVFHKGHGTTTFNNMSYIKISQDSALKFHNKWNVGKSRDERYVLQPDKVDVSKATSIIVLTYNNLDINKRFFDAVKKFTNNYELVVVDNGSTDGTIEFLESLGKEIRLIRNQKNEGVIRARNQGMRASTLDYIICLDNDQIVKANWLNELHSVMENEKCDMVGVEAWEMDLKNLCPIKMHQVKRTGIRIDYVGAGGCLMKRSVLEVIGLYDERFGMAYYEDPDICFRAKEAGYSIGWCNRDIIHHIGHSTLIKGQKDFDYRDELRTSHEIFKKKILDKRAGKRFEEAPLYLCKKEMGNDEKLVTFCMCLKNRPDIARKSVESLVNEESVKYFKFVISEDISDNMLDLSDFKFKRFVDHYIINTGDTWNRSKTCNYGFKRAETELISSWDADFIFPNGFAKRLVRDIRNWNFGKNVYGIRVTETGDSWRGETRFKKGQLYGGMYIYKSEHVKKLHGYDENFLLFGFEELDFNNRVKKHFGLGIEYIEQQGYIYHLSHDDKLRGSMENYEVNKRRMIKNEKKSSQIVNTKEWGDSKLIEKKNYVDDDIIIVMGNGPSLKDFDFDLGKRFHTFGMNGAYRWYYKNNWWPTYFGCFDTRVTDCHREQYKAMIEDPKVPIKKIFLLKKISDGDKLQTLSLHGGIGDFSTNFKNFGYGGNTGVNCCQVASILGYKKIILVGVDCDYVQLVEGAKKVGDFQLEMSETPQKNPNYWFDDYQQKGDQFNVPNASVFHEPAWEKFAEFAKGIGVEVVNCSERSKLKCFRKSTIEKELL